MNAVLEEILDLARWAPSGDNTQPWRFEILSHERLIVHGFDTRDHCVYDLTGHPSQISIGAMLETLRIAAAARGYQASVERRIGTPETHLLFDVTLIPDRISAADRASAAELAFAIRTRTVQRRLLSTRALTQQEKAKLAASISGQFEMRFLDGFAMRLKLAKLLWSSAWLRLTMREAYEVHKAVIQWGARFSEDRIPAEAVGLDPLTTKLMGWVMQDWNRVVFFNRFLAGTVLPRLVLDFLPAIACGAHVLVLARSRPEGVDDYVAAGAAVQRLWLTAAVMGLQHQPELTPLIFAGYARERRMFSDDPRMMTAALGIARAFEAIVGEDAGHRAVWLGRLGMGKMATARSLRLPLSQLTVPVNESTRTRPTARDGQRRPFAPR
jgi:hypothetical protein